MRKHTEQDFWNLTELSPSGCLIWKGHRNVDGYGEFGFGGHGNVAHRLAWIFKKGPIPEGLSVLHKCDNRKCVNVEHLYLGTQQQNVIDRDTRGRQASKHGANNPNCKTKPEEIQTLRLLFTLGATRRQLCRLFKLEYSTVKYIVRRKLWKDLPEFSIIEAAKAFQQYKNRIIIG